MSARAAAYFALLLTTLPAAGQTPDQVTDLLAKFRAERAEAERAKFPPAALAVADVLAAKAEAALKADNPRAAARLARDARWQVPVLPPGLPGHVEAVIGYARLRHADRVNAVAYSPDGMHLASASRDGTVRVWDLGNGREVARYRDFPAAPELSDKNPVNDDVLRVADVAFRPKSGLIAAAGGAEIHLFDPATGKRVQVLKGHTRSVKAIAFSPDGKTLVSGGGDNTVRLWDVDAGKQLVAFPAMPARVEGVAFGPTGKFVAAVDNEGNLYVYRATAGERRPVLTTKATESGTQSVRAVAFTPDGAKLFTGGYDKTPRLTTAPSADGAAGPPPGTAVMKFHGHDRTVTAVAVTADGKLLASASDDKTVRVWDPASGKTVRVFQGHLGPVTAVAVRPDGRQLASAGENGSIRVWDLSATDDHRATTEAADAVWAAVFSPDGLKFAAAGADRTVRVYGITSGKLEHALTGHKAAVTSLVFLSNDRLASAGGDKVIKLWDAKAGTHVRDLEGHTAAVLALAAGDGGRLVSGAADRTVKGWDADAGKPVWSWAGRSAVTAVAVRPGGKQVAAGTADGGLSVLDVSGADPRLVAGLPAHIAGVAAVAYSPDGSRLATAGGDGAAKLWSVADDGPPSAARQFDTGVKPSQPGATVALSAVAFSPDGRQVAAAGADGVVHVWNAETGVEARGLRGHTDWVTAVAFAPDGERLLSAGVDRAVRVFELGRPAEVARVGHAMAATAVAVSRDGKLAVTASNDQTLKVWDLATGTETTTLTGPTDRTAAVAFFGPDKVVSGGMDNQLRWWQLSPPKAVKQVGSGLVYAVVPAADGARLAVWSRNANKQDVFEVYTADGTPGAASHTAKDREATCAAFSADLALVVSGDEHGAVRFWDLGKKDRVGADWPIHAKPVADLALTPDKKMLAAVNADGEVRVSDVATRQVRHTAATVSGGVNGVVMSPTGTRFAVVAADGEVKAFDLSAKEVRSWRLPVTANAAAFTPDGTKLVTANADGTVYVLAVP